MEASQKSNLQAADDSVSSRDLHEAIRRRAEEIYIRNGKIPGRDVQNWSQAEEEIRRETEASTRRTAIIVRVDGVQYIGEYHRETSDGYAPGEFSPGASILVRLDGTKMLVKRPNGKVLETEIVQKIG
jgi:hypothetical protein